MDEKQRKEIVIQYTLIAAIASLTAIVAAFFIYSISPEVNADSFIGYLHAFYHQPLFWIILVLSVFLPLVAYFVARQLARQVLAFQRSIDYEKVRMKEIGRFTQDLIHENFSVDLTEFDHDDELSQSLINLRDTLKINKENAAKQREEEMQRNWMAEGMSHFSEILRNNANNLENMSFRILKDLSGYIEAVQGGFYILDDSDPENMVFKLTSFYAYDRKKFANRQISWGDGLIGTCALEKKTIHIKKVPDSYVYVTSGLGKANPKNILLEPLLYENKVYGVLEFASLKSFTSNHINLVTRVAGSVGSTLAAIKTNLHTAKLLEDFKAQASVLASQEEEMRQNMEELKATQEEAARQSKQLLLLESSINQTMIRAEFSLQASLIQCNQLFLEKFRFKSFEEVTDKHILSFIGDHDKENFKAIWDKVLNENEKFEGIINYTTGSGNELWASSALFPVMQDDNTTKSILLLAIDVTEEQHLNQKHIAVTDAIERTGIRLELDIHGTIRKCNSNFIQLSGIAKKELNSITLMDLLDPVETENFIKHWDSVIKGANYDTVLKLHLKSANEKWIRGSFIGVYDSHHQIEQIIFTGSDATGEKQSEIDYKNLVDDLSRCERMVRENEKESSRKIRELRTDLQAKYKKMETTNLRNEALLDEADYGIVITGSDNRILFFNKAAENLWGYGRSKVLDQHIALLFPEEDAENDAFLSSYTGPGDHKLTGVLKKVPVIDIHGIKKTAVFLLSKAKINEENAYIAFIQVLKD